VKRKPFPVGAAKAESDEWLQRCLKEFIPIWRHYNNYLSHPDTRFSCEQLLEVQSTILNQLAMTWKWLTPKQREEFEDRLVPMWIEYNRLREQNQQRAKAILAQRKERASG